MRNYEILEIRFKFFLMKSDYLIYIIIDLDVEKWFNNDVKWDVK